MKLNATFKTLLIGSAFAAATALPASAKISAEELFAMSNDSAAETIVRETSMGDINAAQIKFALNNMNQAERRAFFRMNEIERAQILKNMKLFKDSDSAAEMQAVIKKFMESN